MKTQKEKAAIPNTTNLKDTKAATEEEINTALEAIVINSESGRTDPRYFDRYLVTWSFDGEQQVQKVPDDACVMSMPQMLAAINEPNGMMLETETLAAFAVATIKRLKSRHEFYSNRDTSSHLERTTIAMEAVEQAVKSL